MEVEPTERTQPAEQSKPAARGDPRHGTDTPRKPKARRKLPAPGGADSTPGDGAESQADSKRAAASAGDAPSVPNANGAEPGAGAPAPAKSTRRRRHKRGGRRKTPAHSSDSDEGTAESVAHDVTESLVANSKTDLDHATTAREAETGSAEPHRGSEPADAHTAEPSSTPSRGRRGRRSRKRSASIKKQLSAPDQLPEGAPDADGPMPETPETSEAPTADRPPETAESSRAPARTKRRKRSSKARKTVPATAEPQDQKAVTTPSPEKAPEKPRGPKPASAVKAESPPSNREMIINVSVGEECRVAILHEGRLEELHLERQSAESHVGNIYKGRVTNVEPSIQAAFVDFGLAKNGFLHISDVQPKYFPEGKNEPENVGKKVPRRDRPPIHKCFRRGQEVIVQITKEGVGTKGPTLTTYLSIPGRYLVMMPGMNRLGVSRKIEDDEARRKMRGVLGELLLPEEMGFILRTAGLDQTKRELQRDLNYLKRLWKIVETRVRQTRAPAELYQESDLVIRTIRDLYTTDFDRIIIDHEPTADKAREFMRIAMPRAHNVIERYTGNDPIFHKYGIEAEIERINSHHVPLSSGGSIVIESTEAMVAIDVNSGKFRAIDDAEETAYQINIEAAKEIARQLRLRDLGGLVVCDFIDMRLDRNKRAVERTLRDELKKHKERARILRMSQFGLIEMTRQRQRPSIKRSIYADCPHCHGSGVVKTLETMVLEIIRVLQLATHRPDTAKVTLTVSPGVALAVLNQRRAVLHRLEQETGATIAVKSDATFGVGQFAEEYRDDRGRIISAGSA